MHMVIWSQVETFPYYMGNIALGEDPTPGTWAMSWDNEMVFQAVDGSKWVADPDDAIVDGGGVAYLSPYVEFGWHGPERSVSDKFLRWEALREQCMTIGTRDALDRALRQHNEKGIS